MNNSVDLIVKNNGKKPILGSWTLRSNRVFNVVKEAEKNNAVIDEKLVIYAPYHHETTDNKRYVKEALKLWGDASPNRTAAAYDAAWVLVKALLNAKKMNRVELKESLNDLEKVTDGATGVITFDEKGNRNNLPGLLLEVEADIRHQKTGLKFVPLSENASP